MFNPLEYPVMFDRPLLLSLLSAWQGHKPFAMYLLQAAKPDTIVELGSRSGVSYGTVSQIARDWTGKATATSV